MRLFCREDVGAQLTELLNGPEIWITFHIQTVRGSIGHNQCHTCGEHYTRLYSLTTDIGWKETGWSWS